MHPYKVGLAATTALLASTALSRAAVLVQTAHFSATTDWGTSSTHIGFTPTKTLGFTGFNNSLGTLTAISISIAESVTGSVNLTNTGTSATTVSAYLSNTLKYILPAPPGTSTLPANSSSYNQSLGAGASSGSQPVSGSAHGSTNITAGNFASYEHAWDITVGDLGNVVVGSGNGNGIASYNDTGGVKITVDYTYTPVPPPPGPPPPPGVPEPASMALLGTGLAGLGLLRRRRKVS